MSNTAEDRGVAWLDQSLEDRADASLGGGARKKGSLDLQPIPLAERAEPPEYPTDALGPILGEAAEKLAYYVQTPKGMAGQSVLAATALAVQGHTDVSRGSIGIGPTALFAATIAVSGGRKTALDNLTLPPIRNFERECREAARDEMAQFKAAREAWSMRRDSVIAAYKPKGREAMSLDAERHLQEALAEVDISEPTPPPRPNITFEEPTAEGIYRHFEEGRPTAGLFSGEGVGFFGGHGMSEDNRGRTIAMLSKLWDGDPITRTRGTLGESGILAGRRLSAHLMMQPVVAHKVLGDSLLQGQGFLARFLICQEPSIAGTRFLKGRDLSKGPHNDPAIGRYWSTLSDLVRTPLNVDEKTGELCPSVSRIEGKALEAWCMLHDGIESQLADDGRFGVVQAFASKAAENAARIAAILALVEGYSHPSVEHIERAGRLIAYYLQSMAVRTEEAQQDQRELQARDLLEKIKERGGELHAADFKHLHRDYRSAKKARPLLALLVDAGHLEIGSSNQHGNPSSWRVREVRHD